MLALKLLVFAFAGHLGGGLRSPSGHTAAGTVVYAGLLTFVGGRLAARAGIALSAGVVMASLFGFTRLMVGRHTLADVLVGGAVGLAGVLALARLAGPRRPGARAPRLAVVAAVALLAVVALHGHRLHAEPKLRAIAAEIRSGG
jgi:membrane-associated phospholipid phosphatase